MEKSEGTLAAEVNPRPTLWGPLLALLLLLGATAIGIGGSIPPTPLSDETPSGFSLARAKQDLKLIAAEPRPIGSDHHGSVQQYLATELAAAGLEVEQQSAEVEEHQVTNLIARIPGRESSGTVLLVAHYDTVPPSPGAADDASGTVAVLETMRQLVGTELRNDVVGLFTDGEEGGLLGARLFAREHPLFESAAAALNFDAIGNGGPCVMFETGPGSGALVEEWAASAPKPIGSSLFPVIYHSMPNNTDFSPFRDAGVPGLNFALCGGSGVYHRALDTPERLEDRALAHLGDTALTLARRFGELELGELERKDVAYVNSPFGCAVTWNNRWHSWLAWVVLFSSAVYLKKRGRIGPSGFFRGVLAAVLLIVTSGVAATLGWSAAQALVAPRLPVSYDGVHAFLAVAMLLGVLGGAAFVQLWTRGERGAQRGGELATGGLAIWALLFAIFFRSDLDHLGASHPFAAAVVGGGIALVLCLEWRAEGARIFGAIALIPAILLLAPFAGMLVQLASYELAAAAALSGVLVGLGTALFLPVLVAGPLAEERE